MATQSPVTEDADVLVGVTLDQRYRLEECIGQGGIGRVYRARHLTLGNHVAIKVLLAEYQDRAVLRKRFEREAAALAKLSHPNIVKVSDFGVHDGMPFLAMELLEGDDLAALLARDEVDVQRGVGIMRQVLRALAYAHERDLIHRDMKPHNVFVRALADGTDHVQVLDFGLARFLRDVSGAAGRPLTRTGTVLGTPAYMAPEQATGDRVDSTADVYSVGVMFYEVVTGRRPFTSADPGELLRQHLLVEPPDPMTINPHLEISEGLRDLLKRAMAKTRSERYANAREMLEALDSLEEAGRRPGPPAVRRAREDAATANTLAAPIPAVRARVAAPERDESVERTSAERPALRAGAPPSEPRSRSGTPMAVALVVLAALAAVGGLLIWLADGDDSEAATAPPDPEEPAAPSPPAEDLGEPPSSPPAPADPLAGPLPEELAPLHAKLQRGGRLSRREIQTLNVYGRSHPEDPRSRLILAHHFTEVRSLSWAYPQYEEALEIDPAVRTDPEMLPDLLEMVRSASLHRRAVDLVARTYGADALPAIRRQLDQRMRREEQQRLERLAERLAPGP